MPDALPPDALLPDALLAVRQVSKSFPARGRRGGRLRAVSDVSFALRPGETLGLVGESGCGKSTLARLVLRLAEPDAGTVEIAGQDFTAAPARQARAMRRQVQVVFQDALSSLNPRMTVATNVAEPMRLQGLGTAGERRAAALDLLDLVGLPRAHAERFPHEFSGGQCQRIAIARALILKPRLVVFDEAVSALDVSIRAQILRLILDLQERFGLAYLFISHDLSVVKRVADRIAVMYLGRIVELGASEAVYRAPLHPYTRALLRSIPIPDPRRVRVTDLDTIEGDVSSLADAERGCPFRARCPARMAPCGEVTPALRPVSEGHAAACFLHHPPEPGVPRQAE